MRNLKSHPDLQLCEHITQIGSAIDSLYSWHSKDTVSTAIRALVQKVVSFHDIGKGTETFQEYIKNPSGYTRDPMDKAHTPISTLLTLLLAEKEGWDPLNTMLVSAIVFGHHRGLPSVEKLREIGTGMLPRILKRQIATLQLVALSQHCGIDISRLDLTDRPWAKAQRYLDDAVLPVFENLSIEEATAFRLKTQLLFSLLLEADKAFLAVKEPQNYLYKETRHWMPGWVKQRIGKPEDTPVNKVRKSIRVNLEKKVNEIKSPDIFSLTVPTGSGKTLLSATWLLELKEKLGKISGTYPKAIVVLPFLSVIDQTTKEYESLLTIGGNKADGAWFLTSHSLSDRKYGQGLEEETQHFFVDTWRTELVITTYDQFLMSLIDSKSRHQMRFHNVCDALIVMDEVQSLPCKLWKPLEEILKCLVKIGNSSVLLMSATLPAIIPDAKPLIENYPDYFKVFNRYKLVFRLQKKLNIDNFCEEVFKHRKKWLQKNKRVLITLNTRKSARLVRDSLAKNWPAKYASIPLLFLSADVTLLDRLAAINIIKEGRPCIVVSTQCIEAGVDIDMEVVIRDFAPLDSIIQIAGRCNRNGRMTQMGIVEVMDLVNGKGKRYADMIYDDVHLQVTRQLTERKTDIEEKDVLPIANRYFEMLSIRKDKGMKHLERFARWQDGEPVQELLRGKEREEYTFLVLEQDPELKKAMAKANEIQDRWKRREAWRALAGRIAKISVSIYSRPGFEPQDIATEYLGQWVLRDGFYSPERGLVLDDAPDNGMLIL
ncbi:CRISPR-associated helicase Cas3' [candidate division NPL-UPA2 bacterium]|nr:CRISPR-associated helicase Cas3' [candidate division NPL-UPA2 bacterium]